jgi:hypothetical protein
MTVGIKMYGDMLNVYTARSEVMSYLPSCILRLAC